jgi:two-component system phosphate regulon response regulator PhoB
VKARVLIVEDERDLSRVLEVNLAKHDLEVRSVETASALFEALPGFAPAVIIVDLMLPDLPGTEICRRLRADPQTARIGIMVTSARGDEYDRVVAFELGVDDYVVKPYHVREVALRVKALVRRTAVPERSVELSAQGIEIDRLAQIARIDGVALALRPVELKILDHILRHPERVFTRAELIRDLWGPGWIGALDERTIDTHVARLRVGLGAHAELIETVPSVGYRAGPLHRERSSRR